MLLIMDGAFRRFAAAKAKGERARERNTRRALYEALGNAPGGLHPEDWTDVGKVGDWFARYKEWHMGPRAKALNDA
jgi:hypothetical protein